MISKKIFAFITGSMLAVSAFLLPQFASANTTQPSSLADVQKSSEITGGGDLRKSDSLLGGIQRGINFFLTLLGTIALVVLLRGGFQMVTAAGDDGKYKKGFTILKQSAVGIILIGLAGLFVRLIFFILTQFGG